jgi:hypothetical protein
MLVVERVLWNLFLQSSRGLIHFICRHLNSLAAPTQFREKFCASPLFQFASVF